MQNLSKTLTLAIITAVTITACNTTPKEKPMEDNVLLQEWTGSYGGVPAFDKMKLEDVKPAMLRGMELHLAEIDKIATNEDAPTFENTIEELERAGQELNRAFTYYGILSGNMSSPEFR
ncbi:MAG: M3 family metallopeptidase, partial [Bacteroidia bacterium]